MSPASKNELVRSKAGMSPAPVWLALAEWADARGFELCFIPSGEPMQNDFIETDQFKCGSSPSSSSPRSLQGSSRTSSVWRPNSINASGRAGCGQARRFEGTICTQHGPASHPRLKGLLSTELLRPSRFVLRGLKTCWLPDRG